MCRLNLSGCKPVRRDLVMCRRLLLACLFGVLLVLAPATHAAPASQAGAGRTFTVNRTDDGDDGTCSASDCSLREAILAANRTAALDTIAFDLAATDATIVLSDTLPVIEAPLLLDGSTQSGYRDTPVITLSGSNLAQRTRDAANQVGLVLAAPGSTVQALRLIDFPSDAIVVQAADVTIVGCELGIAADGQAAANQGSGIVVDNAANARIGGSTPTERNVITAQGEWGIRVQGQQSAGTRIEGNFIGTPRSGLPSRPPAEVLPGNASGGISIEDARAIQIGGSANGSGNVIAGNGNTGISISRSTAAAIRIEGNLIGVGLNGQETLGNAGTGIVIEASSEIVIGGTANGSGNVIAGNESIGILVRGNASDIQLQGNAIGTDRSGTTALANQSGGVLLDGVRNVLVGGTSTAARNVIAGNGGAGIVIRGSSATRNVVQGNYIGIDAGGSVAIGNGQDGIVLEAPGNEIGGDEPAARNVIAGNGGAGIVIRGNIATRNVVQGNHIGTDADGRVALGNQQDGVLLVDAPRNQIGGNSASAGNLISGNQRHGLVIQGSQATGNLVQGNRIGSDTGGEVALSNGRSGIYLLNGSNASQIGGREEEAANIIIGHRESGVFNANSNAELVGNLVRGNSIALRMQDGQLLALGNRFESNPLVFELNSGELRAALNQISGYERALTQIAGDFMGNYNWWGRSTGSSPQGLDLATWNRRLYAVPAAWNAAPQAVQLDATTLQGGSGTAVIVRYARDAFDLPGTEPFSQVLCSDYYTFFTIDGGGLWQASIPIDATPACANVLRQAGLFRVTDALPCRSQLADPACWEAMPPESRPNISVQASEQQLVMSGLQTSDLEAIAYAAGDIRQPISLRQLLSLIILTLLALLAVGGLVWWFRRRQRNAPTQPATNGSDTAATPSSTTFHGSSSDLDSSGKTGNGDSGDGSGNGGGD